MVLYYDFSSSQTRVSRRCFVHVELPKPKCQGYPTDGVNDSLDCQTHDLDSQNPYGLANETQAFDCIKY